MLFEQLVSRQAKLSLVGLGYVGLPIAIAFARKVDVIGFDISLTKIGLYTSGVDPTREVGDRAVAETTVDFTADETRLRDATFHIVAVPTPVNADHTPDLGPVISASKAVGRNLTRGSIVVYESTVYPGVTEDICIPILEKESGLVCGEGFTVGYSPERINPGDKHHNLQTIVKVVAGIDEETLDTIAKVYELVVEAGVYRAESIRVAEAAKVIENSQRDINIAFMNELSIIFNRMGIDTQAVLRAAETKWNFLRFQPGLVGGHCIGVDPYYLTYKAEQLGYHSQVILAGRKINDDMAKYVAENTIKQMIKAGKQVNGSRVVVLGVTFKENCPDIRNTKVVDLIRELHEYGVEVQVVDPVADQDDLVREYDITLSRPEDITYADAVVVAVPHAEFRTMRLTDVKRLLSRGPDHSSLPVDPVAAASVYRLGAAAEENSVLIDVKGLFDRNEAIALGFSYWRL